MPLHIDIHHAAPRLEELADLAWAGMTIIITKDGKPYLNLLPHREPRPTRKPGRLKGRIRIAPDFDEVLPESEGPA